MHFQRCRGCRENLRSTGQQAVGVGLEVDPRQRDNVLDLATIDINTHTRGRIRTLVQAIEHAVSIVIAFTTVAVDLCAGRCITACVLVVGNAIMVAVSRTTQRINRHADRCIGARVSTVSDAVPVAIQYRRWVADNTGAGTKGILQANGGNLIDEFVVILPGKAR